jgi:hypothetical protein
MAGKTRDEMLADLESAHEAGDMELARLIAAKINGSQSATPAAPEGPKEQGVLVRALKMGAGIPGGVWGESVRALAAGGKSLLSGTPYRQEKENIARSFDQLSADPKIREQQILQGFEDEGASLGAMVHAPINALVPFTPHGPRPPGLRGALERWSAERALRARKPTESDAQLLRAQLSTPHGDVGVDAGRVARDMTMPETGEPVFTALGSPKTQLSRLGKTADYNGPIVEQIVNAVDKAAPGKAVDIESFLGKLEGAVAKTDTPVERIMNKGATTSKARQWLHRLSEEVSAENAVRPTGVNIQYPEPPQGRLGLSTTELVPGPEVTLPPQRQVGTEVGYQQGLPLTRTSLTAGPETVTQSVHPKVSLVRSLDRQPPPVEVPVGQTVGVQRDLFGTPADTAVQGARVMTQDPAIAQSVARQGRMNEPSFPEKGPVEATSTNFLIDPRAKASELWSIVRGLQKRVYAKANERYPGNKNVAEAVKNDPELAFLMDVASIGKDQLEATVGQVLPNELGRFRAAKEGYSNAEAMMPFTKSAANKEAIGSTTNPVSAGALGRHALFAGAGAGLGSTVGMPVGGAFLGAGVDAALGRYFNPVGARAGLAMSRIPPMPLPSPEANASVSPLVGRLSMGNEEMSQDDFIKMLVSQLRQKESR